MKREFTFQQQIPEQKFLYQDAGWVEFINFSGKKINPLI